MSTINQKPFPKELEEFLKRNGVFNIKRYSMHFFIFYFRKETNYIKISDLQKQLAQYGLEIHGVDPDYKYIDVEIVDITKW